jgi:hypothetical protein
MDIAFVGVEYVDLPTKMNNPVITSPNIADLRRAEEALGRVVKEDELFVIEVDERRHIVVAAAMKMFENELPIFETSLERFDQGPAPLM